MKAGDILGSKYKLIQRLGKGGMGVVWEATNEHTGRKVALKLILDPTEDLRVRLRREARALGTLNHPNIIEVYDVSETTEGEPFLVMQFLPGQTLGEMLSKKRRIEPPELAARIGRDIASALEAAHSAHIIHRDLKPANIFLRQDSATDESSFTVKVLDFGVSKFLSGDEGPATMTGMGPGSPAYMSPEQLRFDKGLDHRTDIWSLGVVLYEMLTGTRPFTSKTTDDLRTEVLTAPIPSVLSRVRSVPPALDAIVMRCLERDRNQRVPDATSLVKALEAITQASAARVQVNLVSLPPGRGSGAGVAPGTTVNEDEAKTGVYKNSGAANHVAGRSQEPHGSMAGSPVAATSNETVVLLPSDIIPSPMPPWRREMQQALASRSATETRTGSSADLPAQGGTMALPFSAPSPGREPGVTTTTAPIVTHSGNSGFPAKLTSDELPRKNKRDNRTWLYATVGFGLVLLVSLVAVAVIGLSSYDGSAPAPAATSGSETPSPSKSESPAPSAAPLKIEQTAAPQQDAPPVATQAPAGASVIAKPVNTPPVATQAPVGTRVITKPVINNSVKPAASTAGGAALPPCSSSITKNCGR
jgi:serine/threonine protein kinase